MSYFTFLKINQSWSYVFRNLPFAKHASYQLLWTTDFRFYQSTFKPHWKTLIEPHLWKLLTPASFSFFHYKWYKSQILLLEIQLRSQQIHQTCMKLWKELNVTFLFPRNAARQREEAAAMSRAAEVRSVRGDGVHAWSTWWWTPQRPRPWGTPGKHGMMGECPQRRRKARRRNHAEEQTTVEKSFFTGTRADYVTLCKTTKLTLREEFSDHSSCFFVS